MMEKILQETRTDRMGVANLQRRWVAWMAMVGGVVLIVGTVLAWFSLFAGLQPYRGVDVLNGRLLSIGGLLSFFAGAAFFRRGRLWLRWSIGFLGFVLLAFASWSLFQLLVLYRQLAADPFMVAKLGPGLFVAIVGALLIFATFFLNDDRRDADPSASVPRVTPKFNIHAS